MEYKYKQKLMNQTAQQINNHTERGQEEEKTNLRKF